MLRLMERGFPWAFLSLKNGPLCRGPLRALYVPLSVSIWGLVGSYRRPVLTGRQQRCQSGAPPHSRSRQKQPPSILHSVWGREAQVQPRIHVEEGGGDSRRQAGRDQHKPEPRQEASPKLPREAPAMRQGQDAERICLPFLLKGQGPHESPPPCVPLPSRIQQHHQRVFVLVLSWLS